LQEFLQGLLVMTYAIGDEDNRPWGHYQVTSIGRNSLGAGLCEKHLRIDPHAVLSLQSHRWRQETWLVLSGELTVLVGNRRWLARTGEQVVVPAMTLHSMANLTDSACIVHETQEGACSEDDIIRYVDPYARRTDLPLVQDAAFLASMNLYLDLLAELGFDLSQAKQNQSVSSR
jgi:mannose-6-phosphate isomerase-like protein (cupin superfamily)